MWTRTKHIVISWPFPSRIWVSRLALFCLHVFRTWSLNFSYPRHQHSKSSLDVRSARSIYCRCRTTLDLIIIIFTLHIPKPFQSTLLHHNLSIFTRTSPYTTRTVGRVIWPVKSSPKWPIMCWVGRLNSTIPYHTLNDQPCAAVHWNAASF